MSRGKHTTEAPSRAKTRDQFQAAKAEVETELRKIGLWQPCDVDDDKLRLLKQKIDRQESRDLDVWIKVGIPRETLLYLLASVPFESEGCIEAILNEMRNRQASLKSLAQRIKTIAADVNALLEKPSSNADWWFCLHGGGLAIGEHPPRAPRDRADVSQALIGAKALSEMLDNEQQRFGKYLRAAGRVEPGIVQLLVSCWAYRSAQRHELGERSPLRFQLDHVDALARLLTDAFERAGKSKQFTAAGLSQVFRRHAVPLLKFHFEEHASNS